MKLRQVKAGFEFNFGTSKDNVLRILLRGVKMELVGLDHLMSIILSIWKFIFPKFNL